MDRSFIKAILYFLVPLFGLLITHHAHASNKVNVTLISFEQIARYPRREAPATVLSLQDSVISAEVSGTILSIPHLVGHQVGKGKLLAKLDCRDYNAALASARAQRKAIMAQQKLVDWQLKQAKSLEKDQNISKELLEKRESELAHVTANMEQQAATIRAAQNKVDRCLIRAPFDGVILKRLASVGELATPGKPILHLVDTDTLEVQTKIHQGDLEQIKHHASKLMLLLEDTKFPLRVRSYVPVLDPTSRTLELRLNFIDKKSMPGVAGRFVWEDKRPHIPSNFLRAQGNTLGVYVVEENKAKFIPLPSAIEGRPALAPKHMPKLLVDSGRYSLTDGTPVNVVSKQK